MYAAFHSLYIYGNWRSKEVAGVSNLNFKRTSQKAKGGNFYVRVDPSAVLSELPISNSFGVIRVL